MRQVSSRLSPENRGSSPVDDAGSTTLLERQTQIRRRDARFDKRKTWWRSNAIRDLCLLAALYCAIRLPWVLTLPRTEAPDEANHLWVASFIFEHLRLPELTDIMNAGTPAVYGALPALGYLPHLIVGFCSAGLPFEEVARFGSLLAGIPTVIAAYGLAHELFPDSKRLQWMLPLMVVCHPQLAFTQSYVNSDTAAISLSSICTYLVIRSIKRGISTRLAIVTGLLLGWAALSKHTTLALVPPMILGVMAAGLLNGAGRARSFAMCAISAGALIAVCAPFYIRNFFEFKGDVLGSKTMYELWIQILPKENGKVVHPWPSVEDRAWWRYIFFDFWGLFGYMNRYLWRPVYLAYFALSLVSLWGGANGLLQYADKLKASNRLSPERQKRLFCWCILLAAVVFNLAAMIYATASNVTGPHGRYLFPAELAVFSLMLAGLSSLGPRAEKLTTWSLVLLSAAASIIGWAVYYGPLA